MVCTSSPRALSDQVAAMVASVGPYTLRKRRPGANRSASAGGQGSPATTMTSAPVTWSPWAASSDGVSETVRTAAARIGSGPWCAGASRVRSTIATPWPCSR